MFPVTTPATQEVVCAIALGDSNNGLGTWSGVRVCAADGDLNVVFIRSATTPNTPPDGARVPTGWADDAPGGTDQLWASVGHRAAQSGTWTFSLPYETDGEDGADGEDGRPGFSSALKYNRIKTTVGDGGRVGINPAFNSPNGEYKFKQANSLTAQGFDTFSDIENCTYLDLGLEVDVDDFQDFLEWIAYVNAIGAGTTIVLWLSDDAWMSFRVTGSVDNGSPYTVGGTTYAAVTLGIEHLQTKGASDTHIGITDDVLIGTSLPGRRGNQAVPGYNAQYRYTARVIDNAEIPSAIGDYQFATGTDTDLNTLAELATATVLRLYGHADITDAQSTGFLLRLRMGIQVGTIITLWENDDKWVSYRATNTGVIVGGRYGLNIEHVQSRGMDTSTIGATDEVQILFNISGVDGKSGQNFYASLDTDQYMYDEESFEIVAEADSEDDDNYVPTFRFRRTNIATGIESVGELQMSSAIATLTPTTSVVQSTRTYNDSLLEWNVPSQPVVIRRVSREVFLPTGKYNKPMLTVIPGHQIAVCTWTGDPRSPDIFLEYKTTSASTWTPTQATQSGYTITGLSNGTTYQFRARYRESGGIAQSDYSEVVQAIPRGQTGRRHRTT